MSPEAFYTPDGELFAASALTRGPWDNRFQHGGPPAALATGAAARFGDAGAFFVARTTIALLRPVPIAPLAVSVVPLRLGRTVQRLRAEVRAGERLVLTAEVVRIRRAPTTPSAPIDHTPWPDPDSLERFVFPFFQHDVGYHTAIDLAVAGGQWGRTPVQFWARTRVPLVAGRSDLPLEQLLVLADAQSGMGVPLDPNTASFVNPDLTAYFERDPAAGWLGFDIRSTANRHGAGLAQSEIRDQGGVVARSAQSLVVTPQPR